MDDLRALYESLGLKQPKTLIQSGNVVCLSKERDLLQLAKRIEDAIERKFGFHADVIQRTTAELRKTVGKNPFHRRDDIEPGKLIVTFLADDPSSEIREKLAKVEANPEEVRLEGRDLYIYFPNGMGRSKLVPVIGRILKNTGTARNWNSVTRLLEMAEELEAFE